MEAKSAVKMQKWGQKAPSKQQSDGKSATTQIRVKKSWWRKVPSKWKSGGGKCHQTSKVMAKSATTFKSDGTSTTISVIVVVH